MPRTASRMTNHLRRPWAVWLALCIALLGALAPSLSHALVWARGDASAMVEVCTSSGPRWMALSALAGQPTTVAQSTDLLGTGDPAPTSFAEQAPGSAVGLAHCPFCLLMADRLVLPSQPQALSFAAPGQAVVPEPPTPNTSPARIIAAAHPRGPPAL